MQEEIKDDDISTVEYRRGRERFFDDLLTLLVSLSCVDPALAQFERPVRPMAGNYTLIFQGNPAVTRESRRPPLERRNTEPGEGILVRAPPERHRVRS